MPREAVRHDSSHLSIESPTSRAQSNHDKSSTKVERQVFRLAHRPASCDTAAIVRPSLRQGDRGKGGQRHGKEKQHQQTNKPTNDLTTTTAAFFTKS